MFFTMKSRQIFFFRRQGEGERFLNEEEVCQDERRVESRLNVTAVV